MQCDATCLLSVPDRKPFFKELVSRVSSLNKLLRIFVMVMKFVKLRVWTRLKDSMRLKVNSAEPLLAKACEKLSCKAIATATDFSIVNLIGVLLTQREFYKPVYRAIDEKVSHAIFKQLLVVFLDPDGLLRCRGRYKHAQLTYETAHPLLLPRRAKFTRLVIEECHLMLLHSGPAHTLSILRKRYWVPQGRVKVRIVLSKCQTCKKVEGPAFKLPAMPPWPEKGFPVLCPFNTWASMSLVP